MLPVDLPQVTAAAIDAIADAAETALRSEPERPVVVLVTDRHGTGTTALLVAPPNAIQFLFGPDSRAAHAAAAAAAGASYVELAGPLAQRLPNPDEVWDGLMAPASDHCLPARIERMLDAYLG